MNNMQRSKMLFDAANESWAEAKFSYSRKVYNLVVRRCQEAVELGLSAELAYWGLHFPKNHDQAPMLMNILKSQDINIGDDGKNIEMISLDLSRKRGPALQQEEGYGAGVAKKAIKDAEFVLEKLKKIDVLKKQ